MKKMNFSIQFLSTVILLFVFVLASNVDVKAQSQVNREVLELDNPELVFLSQSEATEAITFQVKRLTSKLDHLTGEPYERFSNMVEMYMAIIAKMQKGVSVRNASIELFEDYEPKFGNYASGVEHRLIRAVTYE